MQKYICAFFLLSFITACAPTKNANEGALRTYPDGSKIEVVHVPPGINEFEINPAHTSEADASSMKAKKVEYNIQGQLTITDLDILRSQLARCWSGIRNPVFGVPTEIRIVLSKDRTVQSAEVVDQERYMKDSKFRRAVDISMRALNDPYCKKLNLPPEKYEIWKDMIITFDPRDFRDVVKGKRQ